MLILGDFKELTISNLNLERRSEKKNNNSDYINFTICMSEATSIFINNYYLLYTHFSSSIATYVEKCLTEYTTIIKRVKNLEFITISAVTCIDKCATVRLLYPIGPTSVSAVLIYECISF